MTKFFRAVLLLLALLVSLTVFAACKDDAPDSSSGDDSGTGTSTMTTPESDSPTSTTPAETTLFPTPTTDAPPAQLYVEKTVPADGKVTLPTNAYISGTLLSVKPGNPYQFNPATLVQNADIPASAKKFDAQNLMILYGNKSQDYVIANAKLFMKSDAFPYFEAMAAAFRKATGKSTLQVVNSYLFSDKSSLESAFVTGYSVALNLLEKGGTYSLFSEAMKVTVDGKEMTCLAWFQENCARFGYVFTGLTGSESSPLATFRFVGVPHALIMQKQDIIDPSYYSSYVKAYTGDLTVKEGDQEWTVRYFSASEGDTTVLTLPAGAIYTLSGDNQNGFLVAYRMPAQSAES